MESSEPDEDNGKQWRRKCLMAVAFPLSITPFYVPKSAGSRLEPRQESILSLKSNRQKRKRTKISAFRRGKKARRVFPFFLFLVADVQRRHAEISVLLSRFHSFSSSSSSFFFGSL
jgi:hypothetical protein